MLAYWNFYNHFLWYYVTIEMIYIWKLDIFLFENWIILLIRLISEEQEEGQFNTPLNERDVSCFTSQVYF